MRKAALGRKWDNEHKKLFLEQAKQRKNSYWKGKHLSEEAKEKIRKARTNNPTYGKPVYKLNKDFEIIKEFIYKKQNRMYERRKNKSYNRMEYTKCY